MLVLLPCQSLEDLSLQRNADEANQLLSAWSALFHPALLKAADALPAWDRASYPLTTVEHRLIVVPPCCDAEMPTDWIERMEEAGAEFVRGLSDRDDIVAAALRVYGVEDHPFDRDFVEDCHALGYCHLTVELLTRQLRYMSNLDDVQLKNEIERAITAYEERNEEGVQQRLRSAFDVLTEAREYFYPVDTYLLDLTLTAPTVLNESLAGELREAESLNLFLPGDTLTAMIAERPELIEPLRTALEEGRVKLLGGEEVERPLPLMPIEAVWRHLLSGRAFYEETLGATPIAYARRTRGLTACLPQLLERLGYAGALHYTFDGSFFQRANQSKVQWQGDDNTSIDAIVRYPTDASDTSEFLRLPEALGETMDLDHAATFILARWPGAESPWFDALRRMARYSPALGSFTSLSDYFTSTRYSGQTKSFDTDKYRSAFLSDAVKQGLADPISRWRTYYRAGAMAQSLQAIGMMQRLMGARGLSPSNIELIEHAQNYDAIVGEDVESDQRESLLASLEDAISSATGECSATLRADTGLRDGMLCFNPCDSTRREILDVTHLKELPTVGGPVSLAQATGEKKWAVVDVPPMGYAWIGRQEDAANAAPPAKKGLFSWGAKKKRKQEETPLAEETTLRNDFFEAVIDPTTGAMKSLHSFGIRGNRLSQQIAFRMPKEMRATDNRGKENANYGYSIMAADEVVVESPGPIEGRIRTEGRLVGPDGGLIAKFKQWHTIRRGDRVLTVDLEIDPIAEPGQLPWDSYYAVRLAWADATFNTRRFLNSGLHPTEADAIESPEGVDLRANQQGLTVLSGGLPFHRRFGLTSMDTLLIVRGESQRRFRIGLGIDLKKPVQTAMDFLRGDMPVVERAACPKIDHAWLEHVDAPNVRVTHREPLCDASGRMTGYRLHLLEQEGKTTTAGIRLCRSIAKAWKQKKIGEESAELTVENDCVQVVLRGHEFAEVDLELA